MFNVALDVHANGRAIAMWDTVSKCEASSRSIGGAWTPAETVPGMRGAPAADGRLRVAITGRGQVLAAQLADSFPTRIQAVEYDRRPAGQRRRRRACSAV